MSRAYRIKVHESARRVLRASDHASTQLELLEILPCERMAELLANELLGRGFKKQGDMLVRQEEDGMIVEVDPKSASVTVKAQRQQKTTIEGERQDWSTAAPGAAHEKDQERLRKELRKDLQRQAAEKAGQLQQDVTHQLEGRLADLRKELDQVVNRVTAGALKEKAAQIGHIKELSEDLQTGSLTIVLEV